ncbi:hypothetical protein BKA70DRAFT_167528 [Coprinopsis sp. MPI-PUGE-AT-0042]|nr:hypothetical protein BKA70DRAFT_167528 [Coprinopsis sp. MPI-PUGE-AT-0042]
MASSPSSPTPRRASQRVKLIRRALYGALAGGVIALAFSLPIYVGFLSFLATPIMVAFTLIFTITLLYTSAQNRSGTRLPAGKHHLPSLCRKPTIVAAYVASVGWLGALAALVYVQVDFYKFEQDEREWQLRGLGVGEAMLAVSNAGMFVLIGVLCWRERKEEIGRPGREEVWMEVVGQIKP